jgi:uncharacterized protein
VTAVAQMIGDRLASLDWAGVEASLEAQGFAALPALLDPDECAALARLYPTDERFRSRIDMSRFRFGVGDYKYFAEPLPGIVQALREELYARLAPLANRWSGRLGRNPQSAVRNPQSTIHNPQPTIRNPQSTFPPALADFLTYCHERGQMRPTPLLLSYTAGGYNCLHQDIYGDVAFPLQAVFALTREEVDYRGGEFLLVEQRPRAQSRAMPLASPRGPASCSPRAIGRWQERAATTASPCVTASAR